MTASIIRHFTFPLLIRLKEPLFNQRGQSFVFIIAMLGIILISAVFLYKSGRLTTEKMQLQNAADAAAFSASTLEARSLNFTAYTNRAMVGNEIAIAQAVGLMSLADEFKMINTYLSTYGGILEGIGGALDATIVGAPVGVVLNSIGGALISIGKGFKAAGTALETVLKPVVPIWIRAFSIINTVYSYTQLAYHYATIALVTDSIFGNIQGNVHGTEYSGNLIKKITNPPPGAAKLSKTYDIMAIVGHFATYIHGYTKRYSDGDGMNRMAATVRKARDPFSSGDTTRNRHGVEENRNWRFAFNLDKHIKVFGKKFGFKIAFGEYSQGGSELVKKGDDFAWSAFDTSGVNATFHVYPVGGFRTPDIPTGGGSSQANNGKTLTFGDFDDSMGDIKKIPGYGDAPRSRLSWWQARGTIAARQVKGKPYSGLKPYRDVRVEDPGTLEKTLEKYFPGNSPSFIIGVVKDLNEMDQKGPKFSGKLKLDHGKNQNDIVATVAKSEVYFSRPTNIYYFKRKKDNFKEEPNLFSPFWQARLVQPSDYDRFLTLALQQKVIWVAKSDQQKIPLVPKLMDKLEKILRIIP